MRIFNRFKEWLIQKGVTFLLGIPFKSNHERERCEGIEVFHFPVTLPILPIVISLQQDVLSVEG